MAAKGGDIIDKLSSMPKGKLMAIAAVVFVVIGFLAVYFGFGFNKKPQEENVGEVVIDMQEADVDEYDKSRIEAYHDAEMNEKIRNNASAIDYWNSLGSDLVSESAKQGTSAADSIDESEYDAYEIYQIKNGLKSKEQIDAEHALKRANAARAQAQLNGTYQASPSEAPMTQEQRESLYFARMEKAYAMANKIAAQQAAAQNAGNTEEKETDDVPPEPEEKKIDLAPSSMPLDGMADDGIVTSLVGNQSDGVVHYAGTRNSRPVKATFLKNETLSDGQRVIIRLMQDLVLADGTTIPENTHITGICNFSRRLKINVKTIHYGGRMFSCDISIYDNDGTEGIYCPTVESNNRKKKKAVEAAKNVGTGVVSAAGSVLGTVLTGNPFIGSVATRGLNAVTSAIDVDGNVSVQVSSGYEFYVFENYKEEKNG